MFSQVYGLPDLTPANFQVYFPGGQPPAPDSGWATETSLDVEWAHSVAPHANIALVIAATSSDSDLEAAVLFAVQHHLGHVISNSYGEAESDAPVAATLNAFNHINRLGAARGISVNFSSGDSGDSNPSGFTPGLILPGVSTPADSPWATAVGGTSLAINSKGEIAFQTAWGNNITRIADTISLGSPPVVPPLLLGSREGREEARADSSASRSFSRAWRAVGDSCPTFPSSPIPSPALSSSATAAAASAPPAPGRRFQLSVARASPAQCSRRYGRSLTRAPAMLSDKPLRCSTLCREVRSSISSRWVQRTTFGVRLRSLPASRANRPQISRSLWRTHAGYSALYNSPFSTRWFVLTFGTDSSLTAGPGWDNATGLGTPNGKAFVDAVVRAATRPGD